MDSHLSPENQLNELRSAAGADFLVALRRCLQERRRFFTGPGSQSSLDRFPDADAPPHVQDHSCQSERTRQLSDSAGTRFEGPPEVSAVSEDHPGNGAQFVPSSRERKNLCLSADFSDPRCAGTSGSGVDPRSDLAVPPEPDQAAGCVSLDPDRRGCCRHKADDMKVFIAWLAVAGNVPPARKSSGFRRVIGRSDAGSVPPNESGEVEPSPRMRQYDGSTAPQYVRMQAAILNIGQSGISLMVECPPPGDRKLWVGMGGAESCEWAEVAVRSLSEPQPGRYRLGLSFAHGCPYSLFRFAVLKSSDTQSVTTSADALC